MKTLIAVLVLWFGGNYSHFVSIELASEVEQSLGGPVEQIKQTFDRIIEILQNPDLKDDSKKKERRDAIRETLLARFDFYEMAKRSLGFYWKSLSTESQQEFVSVFTDYMEASYIRKIESPQSQGKIEITKERIDEDYAEIETILTQVKIVFILTISFIL